jgi:chromosome segregation ATPase
MKRIICSVVGLCFLAGSGMATAQSLADLAKKTQSQRKTTKRPARVYTNADVPVTAPATAATATEVSTTPKEGEPVDPNAKPAEGEAKSANAADEANWRTRMTAAREAVSRAKEQLEGMRTRVLHLQTAKALGSNGDVNQQAAVKVQQGAALQEFDRLRADVEKYQKTLTDLEAEARAANVPAGWLR